MMAPDCLGWLLRKDARHFVGPNAPKWRVVAHEVGHGASLDHPELGQGGKQMLMIDQDFAEDPEPEFIAKRFRALDLTKMLSSPRPAVVQPLPK